MRMMRLAVLAVVAAFWVPMLQANTVTFNNGVNGNTSSLYQESGMQVTGQFTFGSSPFGGLAIQIGGSATNFIQLQNGGKFSLFSLEFLGGGDTVLTAFSGNTKVGATVLTGLAGRVNFSSAWQNITSVQWCGNCLSNFAQSNSIDNLVFTAAPVSTVPEPDSMALLLTGLAGLAGVFGANCLHR